VAHGNSEHRRAAGDERSRSPARYAVAGASLAEAVEVVKRTADIAMLRSTLQRRRTPRHDRAA
jgi:hypothetical protein